MNIMLHSIICSIKGGVSYVNNATDKKRRKCEGFKQLLFGIGTAPQSQAYFHGERKKDGQNKNGNFQDDLNAVDIGMKFQN